MLTTLYANEPLANALLESAAQRFLRYAAPNCSAVECATPHTSMQDRTLPDGTLVLPVSHDLLATPSDLIQQAIYEMRSFLAHAFYADPNHLAFLVRQLRLRSESIPPVSAIALTYGLVTAVARRQLVEYFGANIPMAEVVSMSEFGWLAIECPVGKMHVNNDAFHIEFIVGSRPARAGERGELVVTSIGDRLSPHVRYRTGDIYSVEKGSCICGSDFPLATHEGRYQGMIRVATNSDTVSVSPRDVDKTVGDEPSIDVYQLRQLSSGNLEFRFIPNQRYNSVKGNALRGRLTELLGSRKKLSMESVSYIPSGRSGKFVSCASELSETM
jgi:phenylacetate-CoA ligase